MSDDPRVGTDIAGYHIERLIGRGGMSVVYLAEHLRPGRKAALKILATEHYERKGNEVMAERARRWLSRSGPEGAVRPEA